MKMQIHHSKVEWTADRPPKQSFRLCLNRSMDDWLKANKIDYKIEVSRAHDAAGYFIFIEDDEQSLLFKMRWL